MALKSDKRQTPLEITDLQKQIGICITDKNNKVLHMNSAAQNLCRPAPGEPCKGHCRGQLSGRSVCTELPGGSAETLQCQLTGQTVTLLVNNAEKMVSLRKQFEEAALTASEKNISLMRFKGLKNFEIAKRLFISPATLKTHLHNIFQKLPKHVSELLRRP